jgi:hypothetical protein
VATTFCGQDVFGAGYDVAHYDIGLYDDPTGGVAPSAAQLYRRLFDRILPVYWAEEGLLCAFALVVARELGRLSDVLNDLQAQSVVNSATWTLDRWERQLGLPVRPAVADASRQAVGVGRRSGLQVPGGTYLEQIVKDLLGSTALPTVFLYRPRVFVYKAADEGWPGDELFAAVQTRLRKAGRASGNFWLACWNATIGLTYGQVNQMAYPAINSLTYRELNGP